MRGLIPVCLPLLAISSGLLIASCNDSAIPEVELPVPDEEQIKLTPPSANPEPPELVRGILNFRLRSNQSMESRQRLILLLL